MGQTTFGEPMNYKVSQNAAAIEADEEAMAILATGDTHVAIEAGKYVYVRDHSTLARGLYKNTSGSTIAANDPLSSSNLTATTEGGLNELNSKITKHYNTERKYSIGGKGYIDITDVVASIPSGSTIHNIMVLITTGGHLYTTGVGKNGNYYYFGYYNWNAPEEVKSERYVTIDIEYS